MEETHLSVLHHWFGDMLGTINNLKLEEVAAIVNHERSSWGNNARRISKEEVEKIMVFIKTQKVNQ